MGRRRVVAIIASVGIACVLAACTAGGAKKPAASAPPKEEASGTVVFWHFFDNREAQVIQSVVDDFQVSHPKIKVTVQKAQDDTKMRQASPQAAARMWRCRIRQMSSEHSAPPAPGRTSCRM